MEKFNFKKIISVTISLFIVFLIIYYVKVHWQEFLQIRIVSWQSLTALIFLMPILFLITALFFQVSLKPYKLKLAFKEYFGLTMITLMGNYLIPFSGLGLRAVYMKKVYQFSYRHFLTTVIVSWITNFLVYALAGIFALIILYLKTRQMNLTLTIIFLIVFLVSLCSFIPFKVSSKNKTIVRFISTLLLWQDYIKNRKIIAKLFYLTICQFLVAAFSFYFAYLAFGFKITFVDSFLPTALSLYSSVIRIVPASLGFYELAVVYPSKVIGLSIADGLLISAITRAATIFWTFALGLLFGYILFRHKEQ